MCFWFSCVKIIYTYNKIVVYLFTVLKRVKYISSELDQVDMQLLMNLCRIQDSVEQNLKHRNQVSCLSKM